MRYFFRFKFLVGFVLILMALASSNARAGQLSVQTYSMSMPTKSPVNRIGYQIVDYDHWRVEGFYVAYLATVRFDICFKPDLGLITRKVLEKYYNVCVVDGDTYGDGLADARSAVSAIDRYITENDTLDIDRFLRNMNWTIDCEKLTGLRRDQYIRLMQGYSNSTLKWSVPRDCDDRYSWLFN
jgi:hypothetical protein